MAGDTTITVVGNLTADPELRFTPSGAAVANFTVASTPRIYDRQSGEWKDGEALFLRCNIWREAAENVAESLTRGSRVIVTGRLKQRSFETREGEKRTVVEVEVDEIGPRCAMPRPRSTRPAQRRWRRRLRRWWRRWIPPAGGARDQRTGRRPVGQRAGIGLVRRRRRRTAVLRTSAVEKGKKDRHGQVNKRRPAPEKPVKARKCVFCAKKDQAIDYKDTALLRTYISERGKIRARRVTGNCVQHQRDIAIAVKNAREVALLPFTSSAR